MDFTLSSLSNILNPSTGCFVQKEISSRTPAAAIWAETENQNGPER
jgi:hypothetical protein